MSNTNYKDGDYDKIINALKSGGEINQAISSINSKISTINKYSKTLGFSPISSVSLNVSTEAEWVASAIEDAISNITETDEELRGSFLLDDGNTIYEFNVEDSQGISRTLTINFEDGCIHEAGVSGLWEVLDLDIYGNVKRDENGNIIFNESAMMAFSGYDDTIKNSVEAAIVNIIDNEIPNKKLKENYIREFVSTNDDLTIIERGTSEWNEFISGYSRLNAQSGDIVLVKENSEINGVSTEKYIVYSNSSDISDINDFNDYVNTSLSYCEDVSGEVIRAISENNTNIIFIQDRNMDMTLSKHDEYGAYFNAGYKGLTTEDPYIVVTNGDDDDSDTYETTIIHEMGHALDRSLSTKNDLFTFNRVKYSTMEDDEWQTLADTEARDFWIDLHFVREDYASGYDVIDYQENPCEYFADAFQTYILSNDEDRERMAYEVPNTYKAIEEMLESLE